MSLQFKRILLTTAFCTSIVFVYSQQLVESFGPRLRGFPEYMYIDETSDGGILISGYIDYLNGEYAGRLLKLNAQGTSFDGFQKVTSDGWIKKAIELTNGKILVNGDFTQVNGITTSNLSQLNSDGSLDQTFHAPLSIYDFALQSDGKIIALTSDNFNFDIARLNPDGTVDNSFTPGNGNATYNQIIISENDLIYLMTYNQIDRLHSDGTLDGSFTPITSNSNIFSFQPTANNQVIVVGDFTELSGVPTNKIGRINSNGSVDQSFSIGNGPGYGQVYSVSLRANGNILLTGSIDTFENVPGNAFELSSSGELLNVIAHVYPWGAQRIQETSSQKILVTGKFENVNGINRIGVALFNEDHTIDSEFTPDVTYCMGGWQYLPKTAITSDHEVIFSGAGVVQFGFLGAYLDNQPYNQQFLKLDSMGQVVNDYSVSNFYSPGWVRALTVQPDNKVLIGGGFSIGSTFYNLARINSDGVLDETFSFQLEENELINKVVIKESLIYAAGKFTSVNNTAATSLVAVDMSGNVVKTFPGIPAGTDVLSLNVQSDNKVIITVPFDGTTGLMYRILRLNDDGSVDGTFQQGEFNGQINDVEVDTDGKIYCTGTFNFFNGAVKNKIIRLNTNGTIDNTFITGNSFGYDLPLTLQLLPNGNLLVGGVFSSYRGNACNGLVQINNAGSFVPTPAFNFGKTSLVIDLNLAHGYLYVTGRILLDDYHKAVGVAKFNMGVSLNATQLSASIIDENQGLAQLTWIDNSNSETGFEINRSENEPTLFSTTKISGANTDSFTENLEPFINYFYKIRSFNNSGASDFSNVVSVTWRPTNAAPTGLTVSQDDASILLSWNDNSQHEDGFIIQRTTVEEGLIFSTIDSTNTTSFNDPNVFFDKTYFYRVAAFNMGGLSEFSNIAESEIILGVNNERLFTIYPNPVGSQLFVESIAEISPQFELRSATGAIQKISVTNFVSNQFMLDASNLPSGFYLLKITENGETSIHKILKQ